MASQQKVIRNIKRLMQRRHLSGNRLADFAGLSRGYVADLLAERPVREGSEPPSMTLCTLDKLAQALQVKADDLLE